MDDSFTAQDRLKDVVGIVEMQASLGMVMELTPAPLALWTLGGAASIVAVRHRLSIDAVVRSQEITIRRIADEIHRLPPGAFADQVLRPWTYGSFRGGR